MVTPQLTSDVLNACGRKYVRDNLNSYFILKSIEVRIYAD